MNNRLTSNNTIKWENRNKMQKKRTKNMWDQRTYLFSIQIEILQKLRIERNFFTQSSNLISGILKNEE